MCEKAVNLDAKTRRGMTRRNVPEQWEIKVGNYEFTPQAK